MEIINIIWQILLPVLTTVISSFCMYLGVKIKNIINTQVKKDIVAETVKYVEQVYHLVDGEDKYNMALERIIELLKEKGLSVSDNEIQTLIESAVYSLKQGFLKEAK